MIDSATIEGAIKWRQHLHRRPELAFKEIETARFITATLDGLDLDITTGLAGGTGVVATLRRGHSSRVIGIRADIDALPIIEATGLPHASIHPGRMHACGHDGHTAMLLAAATLCAQLDGLDGTVHFIFQPAEEALGGGRRMVDEGLFQRFAVDSVYALHNWPALRPGRIVARDGAMMAAFDTFTINIHGRGSHAAMPESARDPLLTASQIVVALNTIVSRAISPLTPGVVSVTQMDAGNAVNVIAGSWRLAGTVRWLDPIVGARLKERLQAIVTGIAAAHECAAEIHYREQYPATINDPTAAAQKLPC